MSDKPATFVHEDQKQRWVKYGVNVAVSIVAVVALGIALTYLAQRFPKRIDTTQAGLYSLKPQTVNLIKDLNQKIKLVSLYAAKTARDEENPYAGPVQDLIEEYARKSSNIEYQVIDPIKQPTQTDQLVNDAIAKYGGAVKNYKDFVADFTGKLSQLQQLTAAEVAAVTELNPDSAGSGEGAKDALDVINSVRESLPALLNDLKSRVDRAMSAKFPQYQGIVDMIREEMQTVSKIETAVVAYSNRLKSDQNVSQPYRDYFAAAVSRHEAIKKMADDIVTKIGTLGELKVSELQQAIKGQNLILVLGENDWRVINPDQVWVTDTRDVRNFTEATPKPRFAGEQAITTAILSLKTSTKPKVAFLRPGGPPLTDPGFPPFQAAGPFSEVAERLRSYNFEVLEKDMSGMYAMQAQMQGRQVAPEPSDEQLKDAVWIVLDFPTEQGGPPTGMGPKLAQHLKDGGAAMVLAVPQAEALSEALKDYGIELVSDAMIVHEVPKGDRPRTGDWSEEVRSVPFVFVGNEYGQHVLTQPLDALDILLLQMCPVRTVPAAGAKTTPLLPVPQNMKVWGERNLANPEQTDFTFDTTGPTADISGPFYAGAASEKDKSRLVVLGALASFTNRMVTWPDEELLQKRRIQVARFPGNGELFTDAVFWLAHMEPMIAISPAAMQVSRISSMSEASLGFWRYGVLIILLPGLVLAAGIGMYFARRD
jgi:D-ribose pyranose/furanose isomerase RbsD